MPTADVHRSSSFERRVARLVVVGLLVLLALQIVQSTIFNGVNQALFGATGFDRLNVGVHAAIILIAVSIPAFRRALRRFRAIWLVTVAYGAVVVASTGFNVHPLTEARMIQALLVPLTILSLGASLPAIFDLDDYDFLFRGVIALFVSSAIASLWLVLTGRTSVFGQRLLMPSDGRGGRLSASGLYSHRNTIGSFLEYVPALICYLAARSASGGASRRRASLRWVYAVTLILILAHLLLTFSRSSQMVAALSLLPLLLAVRRARPLLVYALPAVLIAGVFIGVATVPEFQRYLRLGVSLMGRPSVWRSVLSQASERPLFGFGLLNVEFHRFGRVQNPHSAYLAQFAYFGIVGLALFLMLLGAFGRLVFQHVRSARESSSLLIVALVVAVLLQGVFEYILTFPVFFANSMFWICLGLAAHGRLTSQADVSSTPRCPR